MQLYGNRDNVRVIRRFTAGGTVYVDERSYFVSFICNDSFIREKYGTKIIGPHEIMRWTYDLYSPVFQSKKFELLENVDYVADESKKIGGNAQKISKNRFVHHTSFLWDFDKRNMDKYLKVPELGKQPKYRQNREHSQFLTTVKDMFSGDISLFENTILQQVQQEFEIDGQFNEQQLSLLQDKIDQCKQDQLQLILDDNKKRLLDQQHKEDDDAGQARIQRFIELKTKLETFD
ncbi:hypothetical protein RFI_01565 [Reticulomyxa filosa]|uniref:BPL/LPL catalytic domain-containing protein n=1 Tax=Reticulomyxa filosa TaxID=46433 RepID=X6PAE4_RETFI|nr:hypothetical protein RFI_01565 [Reticulomyxa filosa]|eukprot:ETO35500.1 hypothetical protein RFI_01565 [Reticulomyxa filosa]